MKLIPQMQRWVAYTSIGASTVRGLGTPGVVSSLRECLADVKLKQLYSLPTTRYSDWLDRETNRVRKELPASARYWGVARKALNIFLRGATYNAFLRDQFDLSRIENELELPLDSFSAKGLKNKLPEIALPRWPGVKHLQSTESACLQMHALKYAARFGMARIHLDVFLWLER